MTLVFLRGALKSSHKALMVVCMSRGLYEYG